MARSNALPADQLAALTVGDTVLVESWPPGASQASYSRVEVVKLTPTQVVTVAGNRGGVGEQRFRRADGTTVARMSPGTSDTLVDPDHPHTVEGLRKHAQRVARSRMNTLHTEWQRNPEDIEKARQLRDQLDQYLTRYDI